MKKIILLLTVTLTTMFTSCTTDETSMDAKMETTSVNFAVSEPASTAKTIDRNSIPLYVDNLTINAASRALSPYVATETFDFLGVLNGLAPALTLNGVALGVNTFSATSTSANNNKVQLLASSSAINLDVLKTNTPYIPCFSINDPSPNIIYGVNDVINLAMDTNHGRVLSLFTIDSDANKYVVVIKATVANTTTQTITIRPETNNRTATFEWSNQLAVDGAKVTYVISILETSGNVTLKTITKELVVRKGKSLSCVYTIGKDDVYQNIIIGGIKITFPTIEEIDCATVYDNEGYNCHGDDKDKHNKAYDDCGYHKTTGKYNENQDKDKTDGSSKAKCN